MKPTATATDAAGRVLHAGQAESIAKQERLFETKSKNWLSWEDAQKARQRCIEKYNKATERTQRQSLLRDCLILAFHTLQPVRRVATLAPASAAHLDAPCSPLSARRSPTAWASCAACASASAARCTGSRANRRTPST